MHAQNMGINIGLIPCKQAWPRFGSFSTFQSAIILFAWIVYNLKLLHFAQNNSLC
jgi:hypothetical protein